MLLLGGEMMDTVKIYLSGGMSGLSFEEQTKWRRQFKDAIKFGDYNYEKKVSFFDPTQYYNFEEKVHKSEREIIEFDLYNLRNSNLIVVNFNNPNSLGTMAELILAKEYRIPVIGWNSSNKELHPWLEGCVTRMCSNIREVVSHVVEFYLN